jgi:hypothetical protein
VTINFKTSLRSGIFAFLASTASGQAIANVVLYEKETVKFYTGGYAALDMFSDTTQGIEEIVGSTPVARPGTVAGETGRTIFSSRSSRFALGVMTSRGSLKTKAHIEADFLGYQPPVGGGVNEAGYYQNPTLRLRHAYFLAEDQGWSILAGQYWSLFGWQMDYITRTVSLPPMTGTLFARTPQLTVMKQLSSSDYSSVTFAVSAARPVQRDSQIPNFDGGIKFAFSGRQAPYSLSNGDLKLAATSVAVTGTFRQLSHPSVAGGKTISLHKKVSALAVDFILPILTAESEKDFGNSLVLAGEYTIGSGHGDYFPRWTGNLANPNASQPQGATIQQPFVDTGVEGFANADNSLQPVTLKTWNVNLQYHLPAGLDAWATIGAAELAAPNAKDLKANGSTVVYDRQRGAYANLVYNFSPEIRVGLEYALMQTRYVDAVSAQNHRVQITTWYRF